MLHHSKQKIEHSKDVVVPTSINDIIFFDTSQASKEVYHTAEEKRVSGNPLQAVVNHFSDPSEQFHAGIWESETGCWKVSYTEHEYCQILEGVSIVRDTEGHERILKAGDNFVIPAGFEGEWEVVEPCRKIYVIYERVE